MKNSIFRSNGIQVLTKAEQKTIGGGIIFDPNPCRIAEACCGKPGYPACREK